MNKITLDFETYYDKEYSLSKLTNEEYIRNPLFEAMLLSAKVENQPTEVAVGDKEIRELILDLDLPNNVMIGHNSRFDAAVLAWVYGVVPRYTICTLWMARACGLARICGGSLDAITKFLINAGYQVRSKGNEVHNMIGKHLDDLTHHELGRYKEYCKGDVISTRQIYDIMRPMVTSQMLIEIDMTMRMYTQPQFAVDYQLLDRYLARLKKEREDTLSSLASKVGFTCLDELLGALRSKPKFAELFETETKTKLPLKRSEKLTKALNDKLATADEETKKKLIDHPLIKKEENEYVRYDYAIAKTDLEFMELAESDNALVSALVNARLENNSSIAEARAARICGMGKRGLLPVPLEYMSAHTGRYGGADKINLQNLPSRGDLTLRESILPLPGCMIVAGDSSQVEARTLAYIAREFQVVDIFASGGDVYSYMASQIYGVPYEEIVYWNKYVAEPGTPEAERHKKAKLMRSVGKVTVLGSGYQMSGDKFSIYLKQNKITLHPAKEAKLEFLAGVMKSDDYATKVIGLGVDKNSYLKAKLDEFIEEYHLQEARRINTVYRSSNRSIVAFWKECQDVLKSMVLGYSGWFGGPTGRLFYYDGSRMLFGQKVPGIMLPDGLWLNYPDLAETINEETGYVETTYYQMEYGRRKTAYIYGGKLCENITQALAFRVVATQAVRINKYVPVGINIHDEWGVNVPESKVAETVEIFEREMSWVPPYLEGCPIACEVNVGKNYASL